MRKIEANLKAYLAERTPTGRYTSFDYCFNHFQWHRERAALYELESVKGTMGPASASRSHQD